MSLDIFTQVEAFAAKATDLVKKGHLLRAAENYGRAEAARALGEDNLVKVDMQLGHSGALRSHAAVAEREAAADLRVLAGYHAEGVVLLSGAVDTLERRRVAGTLLEGKCTAAEEAWLAHEIQRENANMPAANAASWATLVGYEQFLRAGTNVLRVLSYADMVASECSAEQIQSFTQHVVQTVALMQQPRRHGDVSMEIEAVFTQALRETVAEAAANGLDVRLVQRLGGALQRLQRSGVLQTRRIEAAIQFRAPAQQAFRAAVQSSLSAPGLHRCALPGCGAREAHPAHFKSCAACRAVVYCCREHQVAGWPAHKKACQAARKAAEEDDGAGPSSA